MFFTGSYTNFQKCTHYVMNPYPLFSYTQHSHQNDYYCNTKIVQIFGRHIWFSTNGNIHEIDLKCALNEFPLNIEINNNK